MESKEQPPVYNQSPYGHSQQNIPQQNVPMQNMQPMQSSQSVPQMQQMHSTQSVPQMQQMQPTAQPMMYTGGPVAGACSHQPQSMASFMDSPIAVMCPNAGNQRVMTRTENHTGNTTLAWAAGVCCVTGLGCIPFLISSLKDVDHFCPACQEKLATWHRSNRVVIHAFAR